MIVSQRNRFNGECKKQAIRIPIPIRVSVDPSKSLGNADQLSCVGLAPVQIANVRKQEEEKGQDRKSEGRHRMRSSGRRGGGRFAPEIGGSTRSSRQEQRCHRVVWLISRFESNGVVLLVIPRENQEREQEGRESRGLNGLSEKRWGAREHEM